MAPEQAIQPEAVAGQERTAGYAGHRSRLPGAGQPWLDHMRDAAMDAYARTGLPTRRMEEWKYIDLRALIETDWRLAEPGAASTRDLPPPLVAEGVRLVLVDGQFRPDLSHGIAGNEGLTVLSLREALMAGDLVAEQALGPAEWSRRGPLIALNTAMAADGVVLLVADGASIGNPVEVLHWTTAHAHAAEMHARHAILLHQRASATVVERFAGAPGAAVFANHGCHVALARGAQLEHVRLQAEAEKVVHAAGIGATIAAGAVYRGRYVSLGGALSRVDLDAGLAGERAELDLAAVYLAREMQQHDLTTRVRHTVKAGTSGQLVKGVVADRARGVFQGAIEVEQAAQKTEARQHGRALLLSPHAEVDTKPELRIFADDVQCAHGAAIGELDPDHLFYLRARGIDEPAARALLVEAFVAEAVERIGNEAARSLVAGLVQDWLGEEEARR